MIIFCKLPKTKKGPLKSENKTIWTIETFNPDLYKNCNKIKVIKKGIKKPGRWYHQTKQKLLKPAKATSKILSRNLFVSILAVNKAYPPPPHRTEPPPRRGDLGHEQAEK